MKKRPEAQSSWAEALRASTLGWELAVPIFGGVLLGYGLDRRFGTRYIFTVSLLFLGVGAGFYNLWRYGQRLAARDQKRRADADEDAQASEDV